jgi:hypothetical protein
MTSRGVVRTLGISLLSRGHYFPRPPATATRGMTHAGKTVTITVSDHTFQISLDSETIAVVPRTTGRDIHRYKAYATKAGSTR